MQLKINTIARALRRKRKVIRDEMVRRGHSPKYAADVVSRMNLQPPKAKEVKPLPYYERTSKAAKRERCKWARRAWLAKVDLEAEKAAASSEPAATAQSRNRRPRFYARRDARCAAKIESRQTHRAD